MVTSVTRLFTHFLGCWHRGQGGGDPCCRSARYLPVYHLHFLLRTSLRVARGRRGQEGANIASGLSQAWGRCRGQRCLGQELGPLTISLWRGWLDAHGGGGGSSFWKVLCSFLSEVRSKALDHACGWGAGGGGMRTEARVGSRPSRRGFSQL